MEQSERRIAVLEADVRALEEAADASLAERKLLRDDLDKVSLIILRLIEQLQEERDARDAAGD